MLTNEQAADNTASSQLNMLRMHASRLNDLLAAKGESLTEERRRVTSLSKELGQAREEAAARTAVAEEAKVAVSEHVGLVGLLRYLREAPRPERERAPAPSHTREGGCPIRRIAHPLTL